MTTTKERLVEATAELFRRQGFAATGLKQIAAEGSAPIGSLYHHFPGGKEELAAAALRSSGFGYQLLVEAILDDAPDIVTGVAACFTGAAEVLEATDYADACPIATVALEVASTNEPLRAVTAEIFDGWIDAGTARLRAAGLAEDVARDLTRLLIAALEGGFLLSRAAKRSDPMLAIGRQVTDAVRQALEAGGRSRR